MPANVYKSLALALVVGVGAASSAHAEAYPNVWEKAQKTPEFSTFTKAVEAAGLQSVLSDTDGITVFAPTNEAFGNLPDGALNDLLKPGNKDKLAALLQKHIIKGDVWGSSIANEQKELTMKSSKAVAVDGSQWPFSFGESTIVQLNVMGANGKLHAIDKVVGL